MVGSPSLAFSRCVNAFRGLGVGEPLTGCLQTEDISMGRSHQIPSDSPAEKGVNSAWWAEVEASWRTQLSSWTVKGRQGSRITLT